MNSNIVFMDWMEGKIELITTNMQNLYVRYFEHFSYVYVFNFYSGYKL